MMVGTAPFGYGDTPVPSVAAAGADAAGAAAGVAAAASETTDASARPRLLADRILRGADIVDFDMPIFQEDAGGDDGGKDAYSVRGGRGRG